jgi:hypothetical protein
MGRGLARMRDILRGRMDLGIGWANETDLGIGGGGRAREMLLLMLIVEVDGRGTKLLLILMAGDGMGWWHGNWLKNDGN